MIGSHCTQMYSSLLHLFEFICVSVSSSKHRRHTPILCLARAWYARSFTWDEQTSKVPIHQIIATFYILKVALLRVKLHLLKAQTMPQVCLGHSSQCDYLLNRYGRTL